jgi:hypothetical protein
MRPVAIRWQLGSGCRKNALQVFDFATWMGGRAVEGTGLENRQARKGLVGSNPTPSATHTISHPLTFSQVVSQTYDSIGF